MTLKGGTSQACAACRFQRKKCTSECPLAPYFPADQQKMFQNAHRLFGVSNMVNILKEIDPSQKAEAMHSIICQANIRETYPVHGCCWVIRQLSLHIQQAEEELHAIRSQLAIYRSASAPDSAQMPPPASVLPHFQPQAYLTAAGALPNAGGPYDLLLDNIVVNPAWAQYDSDACSNNNTTNNNNGNANNPMSLQAQLMASDPLAAIQQEPAQEYDEMHTFFDTIDDRQSYIDSKEAYDSSSESSLKDTTQSIEHVAEDELKSAAACFSLTSVN